eukprot:CAMPEP_0171139702 /NCGR_PEP_ID=MMETSP0766_2-20121228/137382_1 /TAXON_ID=439317 /ORGANISM="Gambierdiscus australes, Strain CAWD 149" /LENGTH=58 /DNA_ID=CAMNT_0011603369 /DNA_START=21 /DNA_END=197 /DNA_ORIENTATION=-
MKGLAFHQLRKLLSKAEGKYRAKSLHRGWGSAAPRRRVCTSGHLRAASDKMSLSSGLI